MPRSRKYSAMAVASHAPCSRMSGGLSAGVATTTARRMPSGPKVLLTKSCTSRPRSPISPTTVTSALV